MSTAFVFDRVLAHAAARPDAPAVGTPQGGWTTYGQLAAHVRALATALRAAGVGPGDAVLVGLPNCVAAVAVPLALKAVGAVAVEVNREWGPLALRDILAETQARHAVVYGQNAGLWGELFAARPPAHVWVVHRTTPPPRLLQALGAAATSHLTEEGALAEPVAPADPGSFVRDAAAPALLVYTSGSTGRPRGVVQTHRMLAANAASIIAYLGLTAEDRALLILPLFYCYGRSVLRTHLVVGGSVLLDGRFMYPRVVMEALGEHAVTGFAGVPLTFELLRRSVPDLASLPRPRLRYVTQAGGHMPPDMVDWAREAFAPARLFVMYGQTEATARLAYLPPERGADKRGSIGIAIPGVTLQVVDEDGLELPRGEVGQLVARGDNVMPGYFHAPEETAAVLHHGWLWTGDLGYQDAEGYVFLTGRAKEMLKVSGHRVSAQEVEALLRTHPAVQEVAVVGMPDAVTGEAARAFVVRAPGHDGVDARALQAHARALAPVYKVPKRVQFVDALPRNSAGKVLKAGLAELPLPAGEDAG